jgi:hypothetical protein
LLAELSRIRELSKKSIIIVISRTTPLEVNNYFAYCADIPLLRTRMIPNGSCKNIHLNPTGAFRSEFAKCHPGPAKSFRIEVHRDLVFTAQLAGRHRHGNASECDHLLPVAAKRFDLAALHFPRLSQSCCVKVLTNFYSTPLPVGTWGQVKVYSAYV